MLNGKFVDALVKAGNFKERFKMTILAWVAQIQILVANHVPWITRST